MRTDDCSPPDCCPPPSLPERDRLKDQARVFKALGDPTRLEMLDLLARANGPLCVCDIESRFELAQPTISHHLGVLRKTCLVTTERRGTWMHYQLAPGGLESLAGFLGRLVEATPDTQRGSHHA